jgi:hypothetical protein
MPENDVCEDSCDSRSDGRRDLENSTVASSIPVSTYNNQHRKRRGNSASKIKRQ